MDSIRKLEELFAHFPGIGPRQARRFVYYLLSKSPSFISEFTKLVEDVRKSTSECDLCHRIFIHGKNSLTASKSLICSICSDTSRDQATLMVVARDSDYESVEKSGAYRGLYFILGGTVPILDKEPEKRIRLRPLLERVSNSGTFNEIILSLNTTPDGEHTAHILKDALENITKHKPVKLSVLGRGLSTGAELEYVDGETIKNALRNRT
jgi:recombination protein RecR